MYICNWNKVVHIVVLGKSFEKYKQIVNPFENLAEEVHGFGTFFLLPTLMEKCNMF